ncbi:hypothetical protein COO60DRAFT_1639813 [Scenedesmus sp. NREL 46B-D3]|nr:hypothetical protein COO60DRAFT_1639813 [Scenedesmus sp. NREL 46B-D3]
MVAAVTAPPAKLPVAAAAALAAAAAARCPGGTETAGSGISSCSNGLTSRRVNPPGYYYDAATATAVPCGHNTYSKGPGEVLQPGWVGCPRGMWTRSAGRASPNECLVPPGYFLPANGGNIAPCSTGANGAYKEGWGSAASCTSCGPGIYSEAQTSVTLYDPYTGVATPVVYPGMGMALRMQSSGNGYQFVGVKCNRNESLNQRSTFGYTDYTYGLQAQDSNSLNVTWQTNQAGLHGPKLTSGYDVRCYETSSSPTCTGAGPLLGYVDAVESASQSAVASGLNAGTEYTCFVVAFNALDTLKENGVCSGPLTATTEQ